MVKKKTGKPKVKPKTEIVTKIFGKCSQCGKCCKNIILDFRRDYDKLPHLFKLDFEKYIGDAVSGWMLDNPNYILKDVHSIQITKASKNRIHIHLHGVQCSALQFDKKTKKYVCSTHDMDSSVCRNYPDENSMMIPGCGYRKKKVHVKVNKNG